MPLTGPAAAGTDPDAAPPATPVAVAAAAVFAGGLLGGLARIGLTDLWPGGALPWTILVINVLGAFVLGVVVEVVTTRSLHRHPKLSARVMRPLLGTGFCGGFTTFSSLAVALDTLTRDERVGAAGLYLVLSLVLGIVAVASGSAVGRAVPP